MKKSICLFLLVGVTTLQAQLEYTQPEAGLQLSLVPDVGLHSSDTFIRGFSLNLWGENRQRGVALGLVNGSAGESSGFSLGACNYAEFYEGFHCGIINVAGKKFKGFQLSAFNYAGGKSSGFQLGGINVASEFKGFQLAVINYSEELNGLQVGVLNIVTQNPWFGDFPARLAPGFPIVNWSF